MLVNVLDPLPEQIDLGDLAWSLANVNRFAGHTRRPYSVAQHSLLVDLIVQILLARQRAEKEREKTRDKMRYDHFYDPDACVNCPEKTSLHAILHDAHESITGDIPRPVKRLIRGIRRICRKFDKATFALVGIDPTQESHDLITICDDLALAAEMAHFENRHHVLDRSLPDWPPANFAQEEIERVESAVAEIKTRYIFCDRWMAAVEQNIGLIAEQANLAAIDSRTKTHPEPPRPSPSTEPPPSPPQPPPPVTEQST